MHDWQHYAGEITQQVLRIETQSVSGTGFVHYARRGGTRCIATARHVVADVLKKKESFRVWSGSRAFDFGKDTKDILYCQRTDDTDVDSAVLAVIDHDLPMPRVPLASLEERREVCIGIEVGWLGFPALGGVSGLCFFSGRISFVDETANRFLIDGTAVHGCSGGPVFCVTTNGARIIGVLSGFIPNVNMPNVGYLPGLAAAVSISNYKVLEKALDQIPNRERSLKIKLDECPKCSGNLAERLGKDGQLDIVCQSGCGVLVDLLDQDFVRNAPGGAARLRVLLVEEFRRVIDR